MLHYQVARMLGLALECEKHNSGSSCPGLVLQDRLSDLEHEQIGLRNYTSPLETILHQTIVDRGSRADLHCQNARSSASCS